MPSRAMPMQILAGWVRDTRYDDVSRFVSVKHIEDIGEALMKRKNQYWISQAQRRNISEEILRDLQFVPSMHFG